MVSNKKAPGWDPERVWICGVEENLLPIRKQTPTLKLPVTIYAMCLPASSRMCHGMMTRDLLKMAWPDYI
jgi:hypothetical protein